MAGPGLSTSRTAGSTGHIPDTNTVNGYVNKLDTTFLNGGSDGDVLEWDTTSSTAKWATPAAGSSSIFSMVVPLSSFTGADDSAKLRNAISTFPSSGNRPILFIPSGTTLDAGANNPFVLPTGFHIMSAPGGQDEFGYAGKINVRHTSSASGSADHGVFKMAVGPSKGQKFTGVQFDGTSTTRCFVDTAQDASDSAYWQYVQFQNCSWDSFESVWQGTGTGILIAGVTYMDNFSCTRSAWNIAGSDHQLFMGGGFIEMGTVGSYSTRRSLDSMLRFPNTNAVVGPLYTTGSPTTPVRLEAAAEGINFSDIVVEGRPSPGTVGGDTPTDGLHCAGALYRISGGRATIKATHFAYAMRDPISVGGFQPGGFFDIRGGSHSIIGGCFQPYVNTVYPAWTRPDGVAVAVDTQPPLAWVSGATTRLNIMGITRGTNVTSSPVVFAHNGATVVADASVTVTTV